MEIKITDKDQLAELTECATDAGLTVEQYATNILTTWLETRIRNEYNEEVKKLSLSELQDKLGTYTEIKANAKR